MDITATAHRTIALGSTTESISTNDLSRSRLAFDVFYEDHVQGITAALSITLHDRELAADATNEAMTRAYQRWAKISGYESPAAWVYRVGLNWALSWKRRRRRERDRPIRLAPEVYESTSRDDSLDGALSALPIEYRAVVVCRIHLDWSVEQTAQALEIAPGTVKSRLSRALDKLRAAVDATKENDPPGGGA